MLARKTELERRTVSNFLIRTDGRPLREVERQLKKYLPSLDARLIPVAADRAILRGHLIQAITTEYQAPASVWLAVLGIQQPVPISDAHTLALVEGRAIDTLPARRAVQPVLRDGLDWHLTAVGVPAAWQLLGGPSNIQWGSTKLGHIDTGYTLHPAFGFPQASWVDVHKAQTDVPAAPNGGNHFQVPEPGGGLDTLAGFSAGHGTRIGATICGHDLLADGRAYFGVAPKLPYLPMRITDAVLINGAQRQFAAALQTCIQQGVGVVNVSLGIAMAPLLPALCRALNQAYEQGVIVVCAAGNYIDPVVAPARLARTVAVGGVTQKDEPWCGSSFGPEVDFSAPAADLRRATPKSHQRFRYGGGGDGTSYAAAIAAGAAALWLTHRRAELQAEYGEAWCIPEAFRVLARATARQPMPADGTPAWQRGAFGDGILDIGALLAAPLPAQAALQKAPAIPG